MEARRRILVTGATGQQGGAVARELLAHGFVVEAMTRNPEGAKAKALEGLGAKIRRLSLPSIGLTVPAY